MAGNYKHIHLLIVDDLPSDRQLIKYVLEELHFEGKVEFLQSGNLVVERYLKSPPPASQLPDLIILDLNLSDMKGNELLSMLKAHDRTCSIPVVVFSSLESPQMAEACYALGAGGYVVKPTEFDTLREKLHSIMDFWFQPAVKRNRDLGMGF